MCEQRKEKTKNSYHSRRIPTRHDRKLIQLARRTGDHWPAWQPLRAVLVLERARVLVETELQCLTIDRHRRGLFEGVSNHGVGEEEGARVLDGVGGQWWWVLAVVLVI